jgi:glutaredoxin 3
MSADVIVYSTRVCPYCVGAKALLKERGIAFEEVDVTSDPDKREWLVQTTGGRRTVPQIFIKGESIGGFDDLRRLDRSGALAEKLASA